METVETLQWMRDANLYPLAEHCSLILRKVLPACLNVQNEKVLIVGDTGAEGRQLAPILATGYYLAAKGLKLDAKLILQGVKAKGDEAEADVQQQLAELRQGVILLSMSDKLGSIGELGKSFRKFIKKNNHRFVSAMGLGDLRTEDTQYFLSAIDVSYKPMQAQHESLRKMFDESKEIHVTTPAGTDLHYSIEGISGISADGNYTQPGTGGNLPAGEVYASPNGAKVEGTVVIDGSARTHERTILVRKPITLKIEKGNITEISGGKESKELEKALEWAASQAKNPGSIRRVCEFGIGLNPKAQIMGAMIIDDKTLGTAHIGIGSNYWFGGSIYALIHLDQVFRNPTIFFDGKKLEL
ncbi:TPA: aminopeptidase [Candidatus Woesearchaeota archaeon]|nr:MAG: hypothetical protein QT04_C0046G0033 [archaeon GW2011_AR11]HIH05536.1 aminopeptidase [Candidatus Woesearchaeota archaeon]HIH91988.1 aminopeptidase [Candidatus Woesearchaeota archaeon]HII64580.1 aminopeptidase [Candidatus Woesearchaeota archaeon]HIJ18152.1 aminopeptidase [Candidatus Woesearchaeota archaeon]